MPDLNDEHLALYFLQEYHRHGMPARVGIVKFFIEQIEQNLKTYNPNLPDPEEKFNLNNKQRLASLQIGTIAHLMLIIEDVAALFTAFKNNDPNYYKLLDRKGEDDLGNIIGKFYLGVDKFEDEEIQEILGYVDPKNLKNSDESEKDFLRFIIKKNIQTMRYFLTKSSVFWSSHITIFRRYKHAVFPIVMGLPIPENDDVLKNNFDFTTFALTSKEEIAEEVTVIPFSKKAIDSYQAFMQDLFLMLYHVLENNLMKIERKLEGVIPNPNDTLGKRLTKKERKRLGKIYDDFQKSTIPETLAFHAQAKPQGVYPTWYVHLDTYEKSSIDLAIEKEARKY